VVVPAAVAFPSATVVGPEVVVVRRRDDVDPAGLDASIGCVAREALVACNALVRVVRGAGKALGADTVGARANLRRARREVCVPQEVERARARRALCGAVRGARSARGAGAIGACAYFLRALTVGRGRLALGLVLRAVAHGVGGASAGSSERRRDRPVLRARARVRSAAHAVLRGGRRGGLVRGAERARGPRGA
jgi:hypothetical protein